MFSEDLDSLFNTVDKKKTDDFAIDNAILYISNSTMLTIMEQGERRHSRVALFVDIRPLNP